MFAIPDDPGQFPTRLLRTRTPLRLIFWGGLLLVLDFHFSTVQGNRGFRLDLLNDLMGAILILVGIVKIVMLRLDRQWHGPLVAVAVVSVVSCGWALLNHAIFPRPVLLVFLESLSSLAELAAILVFCAAMRSFCRSAHSPETAASWNRSFLLFLVIYAVPLGSVYAIGAVAALTQSGFNINLGWGALLLLPLFLWPPVHFFISTSRMIRAVSG